MSDIDIAALIAKREKQAQEAEATATEATRRARLESRQRIADAQAKYEAELEADAKQRSADAKAIAAVGSITASDNLLYQSCLPLALTTAQRAELLAMLKTTRDNYLSI